MRYRLTRESDGAGDSGPMSMALWLERDKTQHENGARPRVGVALRVGTYFARTYDQQDWWQTSIITEILEDTPKHMKFRTGNSVYDWWC